MSRLNLAETHRFSVLRIDLEVLTRACEAAMGRAAP